MRVEGGEMGEDGCNVQTLSYQTNKPWGREEQRGDQVLVLCYVFASCEERRS